MALTSWQDVFSVQPSESWLTLTADPVLNLEAAQAIKERRYLDFLKDTVPPNWQTDAKHILIIAEYLDAYFRREIDRLMFNMPPRHGKTETVTVRVPAYRLLAEPDKNVCITGFNDRFARRLSRKARNVAIACAIELDPDKMAADEWLTAAGGSVLARGVGSPPTGVGFVDIAIDDPIRKREDAESEVIREKTADWYFEDLYSRLEPDGGVILTMTRWHEEDIGHSAVQAEPDKWTVCKLPAISETGDSLWPERWPLEKLLRLKATIVAGRGERAWDALYQQEPRPLEGNLIKADRIRIIGPEAVPEHLPTVRRWDLGYVANGDYSAGVKMAGPDHHGRFYILDIVWGQFDIEVRDKHIKDTAISDTKRTPVIFPVDGPAGISQYKHFVRMLLGWPVKEERETQKKELRADAFAAAVNSHLVFMVRDTPERRWNKRATDEYKAFGPGCKNDDITDASAGAFNWLAPAIAIADPEIPPLRGTEEWYELLENRDR